MGMKLKFSGVQLTEAPVTAQNDCFFLRGIPVFKEERHHQPEADVTYIWTGKRWAYLAIVLDLFARNPVGWAMSFSPDSKLPPKALEMAWEIRNKPSGLMFHSTQGSHYTSRQFRQLLW